MDISFFCSSKNHPVLKPLEAWTRELISKGHSVALLSKISELRGGDILFLVSCDQILKPAILRLYTKVLVVHASDLPRGRGWSPHIWSILNGEKKITLTLAEAAERVDSGPIWLKMHFNLEGHELFDEINEKLFKAEINIMNLAIEQFEMITPSPQLTTSSNYFRRRTPEDSRIDPKKSIADQFDLLRVADSERYPAFFEYRGTKYFIKISKQKDA